jgi:hypothetical protein
MESEPVPMARVERMGFAFLNKKRTHEQCAHEFFSLIMACRAN